MPPVVAEKAQPTAPPVRAATVPEWFPAWARELAELYFSGTTCLFVLHGNVHDLIRCPRGGEETYCNLAEFATGKGGQPTARFIREPVKE